MTEWRVGQKCAIVDTANVLSRCPELVGSIGEIRALPKPPSKWIDVQVCDGRVLKLQPSALQSASNSRQTAAHFARDDDVESEDENDSAKMSHAQSLKRGTQVTIHRTENVQQRAPHLIGRVGTIKEVPQHPNTWFKVQFGDRRVCTFRPSALRRVDDDSGAAAASDAAAASASSTLPPSAASKPTRSGKPGAKPGAAKRGGAQAEKERDDDDDDEGSPRPAGGSSAKDRAAKLLSSVDAEKWVGMFVKIRVGRLGGVIGRIMRSGNGWVQLRTLRGEVAKRAYELELVPDGEPLPELLEIDEEEEAPIVALPAMPSSSSGGTSQAATSQHQSGAANAASSATNGGARMERPQRAAAVAAAAATAVPAPGSSAGNGSGKTSTRGASRRGRDDDSPTSVDDTYAGDGPSAPAKGKAEAPAPSKPAKDKADAKSNIMSRGHSRAGSSSAKQSAYRDSVRKHLERQRDKFKDRPNLAEWLERLQGGRWNCDESAGGAYVQAYHVEDSDDDEEDIINEPLVGPRWMRRARRRRADADVALGLPGCSYCRVEKFVEGSCWNEQCVASPIYLPLFDKKSSVARRQCTLSETPRRCEIIEYITQAPEIRLTKDNLEDVAKPTDADEYLYVRADLSTFAPPKPPQSYLEIASKLEAEDAIKAKIAEEKRQKELAEKKKLQEEAERAAAAAAAAAAASEEAAAAVAREAAATAAALQTKKEEEARQSQEDAPPVSSNKRPLEETAAGTEQQPPTTVAKVGPEGASPLYTTSSSTPEQPIPTAVSNDSPPAISTEDKLGSTHADEDAASTESKKRSREEAAELPLATSVADSNEGVHEGKKQRHDSWKLEAPSSQVSVAEAPVVERKSVGGEAGIFSGDDEDMEEAAPEAAAVASGVDTLPAASSLPGPTNDSAVVVPPATTSGDDAFVSMPPPGAREKVEEDDPRRLIVDQAQARRLADAAVLPVSAPSSIAVPASVAAAPRSPASRPILPQVDNVVGEPHSLQPRPFALPPLEDSQRQPHRAGHGRAPLAGPPAEADLHLHKPQFALPPSEEELRQRLGDAPLGRFAEHVWPPMPPKLASAHLSFPAPSSRQPTPEVAPNAVPVAPARFPPPAASEGFSDDGDKPSYNK